MNFFSFVVRSLVLDQLHYLGTVCLFIEYVLTPGQQPRSCTTTMAPSFGPEIPPTIEYDSLTKAVLVQLRTGKIGFQAYLAVIGVSDSALCHCGRSPQTIKHVLMEIRIRTWTGEGAGIPRTLNAFLTNPKHIKKTAQFVLNTGLISYPTWRTKGGGRSGDAHQACLTT
jgi:hypothetical protein